VPDRRRWLVRLVALPAYGAVAAAAAQELPRAALPRVDVISVAARIERRAEDTAATASVITREDIERGAVTDLRELLRYEPGVAVESSAGRFGLGDIGIRGMAGNRVLMQVDGIRLPDAYRVGRFSSAARNQLDTGLLRRVEVLRGPGSALYGSDALGGVIAFATVDPQDIVGRGARLGAEAGLGYASAAERDAKEFVLAGGDVLQALAGWQRSDGREVDNQGTADVVGRSRTAPDPQSTRSETWLAKLVWHGGDVGRWRLTAERNERDVRTDVLSLNPQSSRTTRLSGDDGSRRDRASVDVELPGPGRLARLRALAYVQRAVTRNDTTDVRSNTTAVCLSAPGTIDCRRDVQFRFGQKESGASLLAEADAYGHWLLGLEAARVRYDERRDGTQTILSTGAVSNVVGGERLPTRDFPLSTGDRLGAFVQNEFGFADGRLTLMPALRLDRFRTRAQADALFTSTNPGRPLVDNDDDAVSPRLGLLYRLSPSTTLTAQWSAGFRAPPAADVNLGLSSLPAGYAVVPNPDLRAERSRGFELGVRGRHMHLEYTATAFVSRYRDLIVSRAALACPADPNCVPGATGTFQSINVSRARIHGFEGSALFRLPGLWSVQASAAQAFGSDTGRDRPLNTIEPPRFVVGAFYDRDGHGAALHVTHALAKKHIDRGAGDLFAAPAYTVLDLTAYLQLGRRVRLSIGVFNLFDRKYWLWSDLRNVLEPAAAVDRYTQPGRNASVLLRAGY
jgi:hemoglobin/transferrin/lactoferrin receptor protein